MTIRTSTATFCSLHEVAGTNVRRFAVPEAEGEPAAEAAGEAEAVGLMIESGGMGPTFVALKTVKSHAGRGTKKTCLL